MKRRFRRAEPYVAPPDAPPLRDVVIALHQKTQQLNDIDDKISRCIAIIEQKLRARGVERILSVKLPDGADLGWSRDRRSKRWRFVIRTEDDAWELLSCSREERVEVLACGAMEKLLAQANP